MCGITGFIDTARELSAVDLNALATCMSDTIRHRGPDDSGTWVDENTGIALSFRRLAILDLSPTGSQPMVSADGRYVIVFNGETYNFGEIRDELLPLGHTFCGTSDTEIMLAAISQWGIEPAVKRFNGMFAFALWDRQERRLSLGRDRIGIKPLYYGWMNGTFLFGSELKTLQAHPAFQGEIDRDSLAHYLRYNCVHAPYSIYHGIRKLTPGTLLSVDLDGPRENPEPVTYWSGKQVAESGVATPFEGTETEAIAELDALLRESVRLRMIADVPLGAFLSGGVDSSCIVALMQAQSSMPVRTFSIGFNEKDFDEAVYAKEVARHLGTDHTELYVTPKEAMDVIPLLPGLYDEPFADASQIPTFLVSQLARQHVTVSLSGDGGDELFAGYNRYYWGRQVWNSVGWMPRLGRNMLSKGLTLVQPDAWQRLGKVLPVVGRFPLLADKMQKLAEILPVDTPEAMYRGFVSHWQNPTSVVLGSSEQLTALTDSSRWADVPFTQRMMYMDMISYLPDDILVKVDRASMGVSLEARVPFLDDHRVVEFAWKLPLSMKLRGKQSKWLLRQVLYQYVPREMIERPKMGFSVPIADWLKGPLRDWAESLLGEKRLREEGYFDPQPIRKKWSEHLEGKRNWQYYLWEILMFQSWFDERQPR
jgi:asparagine synthase (glutamine-hydrolysing)